MKVWSSQYLVTVGMEHYELTLVFSSADNCQIAVNIIDKYIIEF